MKKIIGIFLAMVLMASCRNKEQLGPDLVGIYGPVTITQPLAVNTPSVNFATGGTVFFTAKFKNSAIWTLTITNATGAQKTITGLSKELNAENSTWTGTADALPSFMAGTVTATLTFQNDPTTDNVSFTISAKRISDKPTDVLVTNFVLAPVKNFGSPGAFQPTDWPSDFPYTSNLDFTPFPNGSYPLPDGDKYLVIGPYNPHQGAGSPYIDLLRIYATGAMTPMQYFPLYADPTKVYFNIMVYNTGTPTWLQVSLFENEDLDAPVRHIDIKPNWTGWKLISVKYSDFIANNADAAAKLQPQRVSGIQIVLLSNVPVSSPALPTTNVKAAFDHITFTHNAPYQP
jgi:hypothetical protein